MNIIKVEEERFNETLNDGLQRLTEIIEEQKATGKNVVPGVDVFKLYDTYGFPKELTEEYVLEYGFSIDEDGFDKEMEKQRQRAREAREQVSSMEVQTNLLNDFDEESKFVGYDHFEVEGKVIGIIKDDHFVDFAKEMDQVVI